MNEPTASGGINADMLGGLIPDSIGPGKAGTGRLEVTPLFYGGGESSGVYRVTGNGGGHDGEDGWALILKVLGAPTGENAAAWNYAHREYHAYGSPLLQNARGVVMPRCLGRLRRPDGTAWLWLEDVADNDVWPLSRYTLAAYHLGRFNGHSVKATGVPEERWFSHRWLRGWLEEAAPAVALLREQRTSPLIKPVYPDADAVLRLWFGRHPRLELLESLPHTLCHLDVHRRNMFSKQSVSGEETVLIDWAFVGVAAVGEELATLVSATIAFGDIPVADIGELEAAVFQGYLSGLQDEGYVADPEQVWTAYSVAASLRLPVGAVRLVLPMLLEPGAHKREQQQHDKPFTELFSRWAAMNEHLIALGERLGR